MEELRRYRSLIDDFEEFKNKCLDPLPRTVRINTIKSNIEKTKKSLTNQGIDWEEIDWNPYLLRLDTEKPGNTWAHFHGWIHPQEEVSAIPSTILDPNSGEYIWDSCAAPGSKTCHMADLMEDKGVLIANDSNIGRLASLRHNTERLGITNVAVTNDDARHFSMQKYSSISPSKKFDRVLADVPCSCEGIIRKKPNVLDNHTIKKIKNLSNLQKEILKNAVKLTREGGKIVYSTCTFAPEENEEVLDYVLKNENSKLIDFELSLDHSLGINKWNNKKYKNDMWKAKRIYPHQNNTGGFFCAKLEVTE